MSNAAIVRRYLDHLFSGPVPLDDVRALLADDFVFVDPMMSAESADDYIGQLRAFGDGLELHGDVRCVVEEGEVVVALVDFQGPQGKIAYSQWFWLEGGKITRLESMYDPRGFFPS